MKIFHKLILGFLAIILLILAVGYFIVNTSREALEKSIGRTSIMLAQEVLDKIDRNIYNEIEHWRFVSVSSRVLHQFLLLSNQEFDKLDNQQAYIDKKDKEWVSVEKETITPFISELNSNKLSRLFRIQSGFYEKEYGFKVHPEIFVTNKYGANVAQTQKTFDYRQDDEEWWQRAKADGLYVSDVVYDRSADVYAVDIAIRVNDKEGNFIGVMEVVLNIEKAISILKELEKGAPYATTHFELFTKDGRVIYSKRFKSFEYLSKDMLSRYKQKPRGYFTAQCYKTKEEGLFAYVHSNGYRNFKGLGWGLIVDYETKEIFAPIMKLKKAISTALGVLFLIILIIGFLVVRSVSVPIMKLEEAAAKIGKGDLDIKIDIVSQDEAGRLAVSFNKMIEDLKKTTISKDYLDNIIRSMGEALVVVTPQGEINTANKAASKLLGYRQEELIGKDVSLIFTEEEIPLKGAKLDKLAKEGRLTNYETSYKAKDGGKIPVLFSSAVIRNTDGNITNIICVARDITERKKAQDEKNLILNSASDLIIYVDRDYNIIWMNERAAKFIGKKSEDIIGGKCYEELMGRKKVCEDCIMEKTIKAARPVESEINLRGRTLLRRANIARGRERNPIGMVEVIMDITERKNAEERLKKYSQDLEKANRELDDFTYIVSHDLREPLRSIDAFSKFIEDDYKDRLDEEGVKYLERIRVNTGRMQALIENLLNVSRIDRKKNPFEEVQIEELINEVKLRLEYLIKQKNAEIIIRDRLPKVFCGRVRLTEVFVNLISNAVKFCDKQNPRVEIGLEQKGNFYEFYVKDNGQGIEERYFSKIFEIFQRLGKREDNEGTGAGLTIVKKVVEMHKGKVWVESKIGEGTTFYFTIPKKY